MSDELPTVTGEFLRSELDGTILKNKRKKGGPYPKLERINRRKQVFQLHFEEGISAEKIAENLSDGYFESRPRGSQLSAIVSNQSEVIENRIVLENELKKLFGENITVIVRKQMTEGSPQSILLAKDLINNEEELIIDLGDQYLDLNGFTEFIEENKEKLRLIKLLKKHFNKEVKIKLGFTSKNKIIELK